MRSNCTRIELSDYSIGENLDVRVLVNQHAESNSTPFAAHFRQGGQLIGKIYHCLYPDSMYLYIFMGMNLCYCGDESQAISA